MRLLPRSLLTRFDQRFATAIVVIVASAVLILTWAGIRQSRADSFELLVLQGKAFTESLAQAAQNAIVAETFYDYLIHLRYSDITALVADVKLSAVTDHEVSRIAQQHGLYGLFVFASDSGLVAGSIVDGPRVALPEFVYDEVRQLIANPESNYVLLLEEGERPGESVQYHLEVPSTLDRVVLVMADALYYVDALQQTQIGYLAQNMARERGVVYIIYQSTEGIIFSSRATGPLLAIESDPFLSKALESDSMAHRVYEFQDLQVLELVRPFATGRYPFGLLRVGLSLDGFYSVSRGFDRQMTALAGALFILAVVALLYLNSRQKRQEITRRYTEIKSITDKIFDEMRTGVAAVDAAGRITLANAAFERTFAVGDCVGRRWQDIMDSADLSLDRLAPASEALQETELTLDLHGVRTTLLVATSRLHDEFVQPAGLVVVVYDITRLKEYERKSARRERLSELGNLAAGVAHEIRNPLNTISIATQRLASEFVCGDKTEEYRTITSQIRSETKRLNEIITRFLALTREEAQRQTTIDLAVFLTDTVKFFSPETDSLQIDLTCRAEPALYIQGDADALKQVFLNLFNNAKEALNGRPGRVAIAAQARGNEIEVSFSDSGPGIPAELRERIFTPYFTTKKAGTGLGLPTVHKLVTELGGDIRVEDAELGGAMFVITLSRAS